MTMIPPKIKCNCRNHTIDRGISNMAATPKTERKFMKSVAKMNKEHEKKETPHKGVRMAKKESVLKSSKKAGDSKKTKSYLRASY